MHYETTVRAEEERHLGKVRAAAARSPGEKDGGGWSMNSYTPLPRTALVVEDNELTLEVLHYALEGAGFATSAVDRGSSAMMMLVEHRFDVLVVDINLPDMNGLSICESARKHYQDQVAIVVITGLEIGRRGLAALQVCADDFLGKPFELDELIARIESKLRRAPTSNTAP